MSKNSISKKINLDIDDYKKLSEINLLELFLKESIILETIKESIPESSKDKELLIKSWFKKFDKKITNITGIHPNMLDNKKHFINHIDNIIEFIEESDTITYLIAHNNDGFDKHYLRTQFKLQKYDNYKQYKFIDTLILARILLPELYSHSMKTLCQHFDISLEGHRAKNDTVALKNVYHKLLQILSVKLDIGFDDLLNKPSIVYQFIYC